MASRVKNRISDKLFVDTCENSQSMAKACAELNLHFNSFKKRAIELNCYKTNQSGVGLTKLAGSRKIPLGDILNGLHPYYSTSKLRVRLIKEKLKKHECEICSISEWQQKKIDLELDHIDGNKTNHELKNLRILCPNCHSQTGTYRSKNKKMAP